MSIPPGTDTEKSSIGGVRLLNGIAHCDVSCYRPSEMYLWLGYQKKWG